MATKPLLLALVLLAGCATTGSSSSGGTGSDAPRAASALPDFELNTVDGDTARLSDHLGRDVVLLAFWDTWCEPCKTELPHLNRIYQAKKDQGFVVFAISMDDPSTAMQVAPYVHEAGFTFPVLLDPNNKAANLYNTHKSAPYTVLIGRDGSIAQEGAGFDPATVKPMEERIEKLLAAK
ncbi:MAG: TlpA disulfide reductase family protein [Myxococcaceae bacterium]